MYEGQDANNDAANQDQVAQQNPMQDQDGVPNNNANPPHGEQI